MTLILLPMTEDLSTEPLADASLKSAADGGVTVESLAITLADLNAQLGGNFKDTATALKALKDTKDFVGKRKEDIAAEVKASLIPANPPEVASKGDVQELNNRLFLAENPQYKDMVDTLKAIDPNLANAVKAPGIQSLIEKAQKADEVASNKSVVASNSRLSQVKSVVEQAVAVTNARGSTNEDTALVFASAINAANNER
jgi:hypothetical protein